MASDRTNDLLELLLTSGTDIEPTIRPLSEVLRGDTVRVTCIDPGHADRLSRLTALGIAVGAELTLIQKHPAWVVRAGQTEVALDKNIARDIYVTPL